VVALVALGVALFLVVAVPRVVREDKRDREDPERWKDFL